MGWTNRELAGGGGGVSSVTNADGTITITGTTSAPVVSRSAITGDVSVPAGSDAAVVQGLQGHSISATAPGASQVLAYVAGEWGPWSLPAIVSSVTNADGTITIGGSSSAPTVSRSAITGDVSVPAGSDAAVVEAIQGTGVKSTAPTDGQLLRYDSTSGLYVPVSGALVFRGAWAATTAYKANDTVTYNGCLWSATTAFTSGASFNPANWTCIAGTISSSVSYSGSQTVTGSTTNELMFGFGTAGSAAWSYTPGKNGNLTINVDASVTCSTAADIPQIKLRYGTGAAPANGAAVTGTAAGQPQPPKISTAADYSPFGFTVQITGLAVGTAIWLDFSLLVSAGTPTVTIAYLMATILES